MSSLRISATDLDAIRYWRGQEDAALPDLLAQLRREAPPTPAMERGSAFHHALEVAQPGDLEQVAVGEYLFDLSAVSGNLSLPPIREVKSTREYQVEDVTVTLVGKADAIHGRTGYDHKLTKRMDPERYLQSYQWRVYLEVFDLDRFQWNVFVGDERGGPVVIRELHQLGADRYPGLSQDLEAEIFSAVALYKAHLPERIAA